MYGIHSYSVLPYATYQTAVSVFTEPDGLDYRATDNRPHHSVTAKQPYYRATDNRPHYEVK